MKFIQGSRFFFLVLSCALLIAPLPISAMVEDLLNHISTYDKNIIMQHPEESYIFLDKQLSPIIELILHISEFDNDSNSLIHQLKQHIQYGYTVVEYNAALETLQYAENFLQRNYNKFDNSKLQEFAVQLKAISKQVVNGELTCDAHVLQSVQIKKDTHENNKKGKRSPPYTATIQGVLSVTDVVVTDSLTTPTLSATDVVIQGPLQLNDAAGGEYIGLQAPAVVPTTYVLTLPAASPTSNQVLRAGNAIPTNLGWVTEGGSITPAASKTIYVTKYGNDTSGDGSFSTPYASLAKAIQVANTIASSVNPIAIAISSGIYTEDNSAGPLIITVAGVSIIGESTASVVIRPSTPANNLLLVNNTVRIGDITFQSSSPLATGISLTAGSLTVLSSVRTINFLIGINCSGGATQTYGFNNCLFVQNGTALNVSSTRVQCNGCTIFGTSSTSGPAANTGMNITGLGSSVVFTGGVIGLCITGMNIINNALTSANGISFRLNEFDIVQNSASHLTLSGCTFELTTGSSDIDLQVSGAGTIAEIISCEFSGSSVLGAPQGLGVAVSDDGFINISGSVIHNYTTGIQVGGALDTSSTTVSSSGLIIRDCATDVLQQGTATLLFNASTASSSKIIINDATNVELAFFNLDDNEALTIGSTADEDSILIQIANDPMTHPGLNYKSSLYSTQALGFENPLSNPSSAFVISPDNANFTAITTDRAKLAGLRLVSDTDAPVGGTSALRGWDINKNASTAELSFTYRNSDIIGQSAVSPYVVMQLDGVNNQLQLPTAATQIIFTGDTNLYRSAANVLKTDDNFIVGTLTPDRVVVTAPVTNQFASSSVTGTELGYLSGVTSSIQTQLNGKVAKAGDTMTGTLQLPAGTTALPSLVFTGSTTSGLSASAGDLSFSTNAIERLKIANGGTISVDAFTSAGVVHNDASGNLSSSLIVNGDIANATISNSKLATISSTNTTGNIVVRDGSGNFATNMITLAGAVTNATDAATKSYVDAAISTGIAAKTPAVVVSLTDETLSGLATIDSVILTDGDRVLLTGQADPVENGLWVVNTSGAWTRPADFASGSTAGQAYVLILSGATEAGSAWLCNTPTAIVDTDPINFALFSLPDTTTGANVGAGTGLIFRNKTGSNINFKTLVQGSHVVITNNTDDITLATDATSSNTASTIVSRDVSGNFSAGTITANLTGSASNNVLKAGDTMTGTLIMPAGSAAAPSIKFTGSTNTGFSAATANTLSFDTNGVERLSIDGSGNVTINGFGTTGIVHNDASGLLSSSLIVNADVSASAAIVDTKLATISTAGKVANSATTATSANTPNTIVLRDGSGNFSAGTVIANLTGSASNNVLKAGDTMTGALQLPAGTTAAPSLIFTGSTTTGLSADTGALSFSTNGIERMVISSSGVISVNAFITPGIVHNDASGGLSTSLIVNADVSASAGIIDTKLATISTAGKVANSATTATAANTASTIVARDVSGSFSTSEISVIDEVISNSLTVTPLNTAGVVHNDTTGLLSTSLIVDADVSASAGIVDTKLATISTAGKVSNSATTATSANTASTIVARDASGNFSAGTITANLNGNATTATNFSGSLSGDVTGTQGATVVSFVGGQTAANVAAGSVLANAATSANTVSTIVRRSAAGSFSTSTISVIDEIISNTLTIVPFATAGIVHNDASGLLSTSLIVDADVSASAGIVDTKLATISTAGKVSNSATTATSANTASAIVARDGSGNFSAGTITANLSGNATTATTATNFSGSLAGEVTGTQGATVVSNAVSANTANAIVRRTATGGFSAGAISVTDVVASGNLNLTTEPSSSTAGNILKNGNRFIHDFGTNNTFVGLNAGNFSMSGTGSNSGFGINALTANTTGSLNTAIGSNSLSVNTIGSNNTAVGYNALIDNITGSNNIAIGNVAGLGLASGNGNIYIDAAAGSSVESDIIRIGTSQAECFIAGITGVGISGDVVVIDTNGQLGITLSSARYKHNIQDMGANSTDIFKLRPVTFVYNNDETETKQYGLIAEEVDTVFPTLVSRDEDGLPHAVRYHLLPALLLNEIQKQHATIEEIKKQYVSIETMNSIIDNLKLEVQNFIERMVSEKQ